MADSVERQIFADAAARPESEDTIAPDRVDSAVSEAIHNLGRDPPSAPPSERRPAQADDPLAGIDDRSNSGLLRALLDERDKRQDLAGQLTRYQREEQDRQAREQRPNISESLFSDPEGTLNRLREEWTQPLIQQMTQIRLDSDFKAAHARYGESFEQAWGAWFEAVKDGRDAQSYFAVMNAPSPGEALVGWYRMQEILRTIGDGGLDGYRAKVIEEYLAGQGNAADRPRGPNGQFVARPQAQPQRLPTATSRLGGSGDPGDDDDDGGDGSDAAIFAAARPPKRRR